MISVIMPLYNAERFLEETLDSISKQTYGGYELICINDDSQDSTVDIVKSFMVNDNRIKLLHNDVRSGAAYSRNKGLKEAKGDYCIFLDGDDIFEEDLFAEAYPLVKEKKLDVLIFECMHVLSENIYEKKKVFHDEWYKNRYCTKPFKLYDLKPIEYKWSNHTCNKMYRRDFLLENKLEFQPLPSSNDVYFGEMVSFMADRILSLDDDRVMVYARDHSSPDRISFDRDPMCVYKAYIKILKELKARGVLQNAYDYIYYKCYWGLINGIKMAKTENRKRQFYDFLRSEGIGTLMAIGDGYQGHFSKVFNMVYANYSLREYDSLWFEYEDRIIFEFMETFDKLIDMFAGNKVVVWGAGHYGNIFIRYLEDNKVKAYSVVDISEKKWGEKICSYIIKNPLAIDFDNIDIVIVAAASAIDDVRNRLKGNKCEVVDMFGI
jgi:glycosyltransferase involved in cell wall biosynthesis